MIKKISFGQYGYKKSMVHSLDSRLKLLYVLFLSILIFLINDFRQILIFSFFIFVVILLSKIEIKTIIKNLKTFIFIFIFIFAMYVVFSRNDLEQGLITIWRFLMLIMISTVLTFTTTTSSLITAIEKLARPLKIVGIKPRNIAVLVSVTIRFIPVMFINMEKTKEAMISRLADFKKVKNIKTLILVLLEKMFKSASNLSDAMQSRLYNENAKSYKTLRLGVSDYASMFVVVMFIYTLLLRNFL